MPLSPGALIGHTRPEPDPGALSIGVVGLGGVSRFYLDAISRAPGLALSAVCDIDPERLESVELPGVAVYDNAEELLLDSDLDAVVVDTPVATHVDLCRAALTAGKHVCCEKPLALTRADASPLLELSARKGLTLFTAFHRRYNWGLPRPESIRREGLVSIESRYYECIEEHSEGAHWYSTLATEGGGCIVDNGPNAFDVVRHLFGPVSVTAATATRSAGGADLDAVIHGSAAGALVVIRLDWAFDGESKDIRARWRGGAELYVDLLAGFTGFKSSLDHEYDGVLDDFARHIADSRQDRHGFAATAWLEDVLRRGA